MIKIIYIYINLLSYEQLIALNNPSTIINELNTNPIPYYDLYNSQGHTVIWTGYPNAYLTDVNKQLTEIDGYYFTYYPSTHIWELEGGGPT